MSATTTSTTTGSLSVLADYEVHHSGTEQNDTLATTFSDSPGAPPASEWASHWRRMPAYRPVNRHLDLAERPAGNGHPAEYAFIQIMLHGCWINSTISKIWRATGGKVNDKIFYYDIGGEF